MAERPTFRPNDRAALRGAASTAPRRDLVVVWSPVDGAIGRALAVSERPVPIARVATAHGEDDWMSREHATVRLVEGVRISDGGEGRPSANGTFLVDRAVGEIPVRGEVELRPGQLVRTGRTLWTLIDGAAPPPQGTLLGGVSEAMGHVRDELQLVVAEVALRMERQRRVTQSLLVTGPRGTGKQVVAREAHRLLTLRRGEVPFIDVPAPALADGTSAADVFGVVDKYATDVRGRPGYFERAHGGVLLIDEVADLPLGEQAKLLNVLEERQVTRLGAKVPFAFDCLVVAATNRDLDALVDEGAFRADLLDRLRRFHVHLRPLDERPEDTLPIVHGLLRRHAFAGQVEVEVAIALWRRPWPGSVRELDALSERLIAVARNLGHEVIDMRVLERATRSLRGTPAETPRSPAARTDGKMPTRDELVRCLDDNDWNKTEVGRIYGKHPRQITRWMEYLGIARPVPSTE